MPLRFVLFAPFIVLHCKSAMRADPGRCMQGMTVSEYDFLDDRFFNTPFFVSRYPATTRPQSRRRRRRRLRLLASTAALTVWHQRSKGGEPLFIAFCFLQATAYWRWCGGRVVFNKKYVITTKMCK